MPKRTARVRVSGKTTVKARDFSMLTDLMTPTAKATGFSMCSVKVTDFSMCSERVTPNEK
jgi:hypothetical protein